MKNYLVRSNWQMGDYWMTLMTACFAVWMLFPSASFLHVDSIAIDDAGEVTFIRSVPFGGVYANWVGEVRTGRFECHARGGPDYYQRGEDGGKDLVVVRYSLHASLFECIQPGEPFTLSQTHQVHLFNAVPLRPSRRDWRCLSDGKPCVPST